MRLLPLLSGSSQWALCVYFLSSAAAVSEHYESTSSPLRQQFASIMRLLPLLWGSSLRALCVNFLSSERAVSEHYASTSYPQREQSASISHFFESTLRTKFFIGNDLSVHNLTPRKHKSQPSADIFVKRTSISSRSIWSGSAFCS